MFSFLSLLSPRIAEASAIGNIMLKVNTYIINPAILIMFGIAIVMFVYGLVEYLAQKDNADAAVKGKRHMVWGIIGLFIMVSVFAIMRIMINALGVELPPDAMLPNA